MEAWLIDHVTREKPIFNYWQFDDDASSAAALLPHRHFASKAIYKQKYGGKSFREKWNVLHELLCFI